MSNSAIRKLSVNKRWLLWLPLLALAVWLGLFADKTPTDQTVQAKPSQPNQQSQPKIIQIPNVLTASAETSTKNQNSASMLEILVDRSNLIGADQSKSPKWRNLFASSSWTPPPLPTKPMLPIPAPVTTPVAATAPVFPFQYVGKKFEDNIWEVYLSRGDQSFLVREGGTLEGAYRIDTITPQRLTVTYLPLGQSQSLSIGESQ
jgi:hypothetical protein